MSMKKVKYVVVGQGLAGTAISMRLRKKGISHLVIDDAEYSLSSKVAAGLINPIVLKRLSLVADAGVFLPAADVFYKEFETLTGVKTHFNVPLKHIFNDIAEVNHWQEKMGDARFYDHLGEPEVSANENIKAPFGVAPVKTASWLNTRLYLDSYAKFLESEGLLVKTQLSDLNQDSINALGVEYEELILCVGFKMPKSTPELKDLFRPTKGEVLTIYSEELPQDYIVHKKIFILPYGEHMYKVGSTYNWNELDHRPSAQAKEELLEALENMFGANYEVVEHEAGVRPNTKDRKPLMGTFKGMHIFNGLGSRGALMAPYLSQVMVNYLLEQKPIPQKWDLKRFI